MNQIKIPLGEPLSANDFALSPSFPLLDHIIAYELADAVLLKKLTTIYPRFGLHPYIQKFIEEEITKQENYSFYPFCSEFSANLAHQYLLKNIDRQSSGSYILEKKSIYFVAVRSEYKKYLSDFWQFTGIGLGARKAYSLLKNKNVIPSDNQSHKNIINKLSALYQQPETQIKLFPSGMTAYYAILNLIYKKFSGPILHVGFPYTDNLKLPQHLFSGVELVEADDINNILENSESTKFSAISFECPSNPQLNTPDINQLKLLSKKLSIPLIADDTLSTPYNTNLINSVDFVYSSLSKSFSGSGNVMAGSLCLNKNSNFFKESELSFLKEFPGLCQYDAFVLNADSESFVERISLQNENCWAIYKFLAHHPRIIEIYHTSQSPNYYQVQKSIGRNGFIISFLLEGGFNSFKYFYDNFPLRKGPSLGNSFTMLCPYTLLAHFHEIKFTGRHNISPYLLRLSIGIESADEIISAISKLLNNIPL